VSQASHKGLDPPVRDYDRAPAEKSIERLLGKFKKSRMGSEVVNLQPSLGADNILGGSKEVFGSTKTGNFN
jgi:hypothetical protein